MADKLSIEFALTPVFNTQAFNAIIGAVKGSLGELGNNIQLIDPMALDAQLSAFSKKASEKISQIAAPPPDTSAFKPAGEIAGKQFSEGEAISLGATPIPAPDTSEIPKAGAEAGAGFATNFESGINSLPGAIGQIATMAAGAFAAKEIYNIGAGFADAGGVIIESSEKMKVAFAQAGVADSELNATVDKTISGAIELANRFAVPIAKVKEFSQMAAGIGGASGQANADLTQLALGIEKVSNGLVSGSMAIRIFSKGITDPEGEFAMGRLQRQFPALATAMKDLKDPAEATQKALAFFGPTFKQMTEQAQGPIGSMERMKDAAGRLQGAIGAAGIELFTPLISGIADKLVPALTGVVGFFKDINDKSDILSTGVKMAGIAFGVLAIGVGVASIAAVVSVPAFGLMAAAVWAAMAPILPFVALATALGVAIAYESGAFNESADAKLKDAQAQDELINKQIKAKETQIDIINSKQDLIDQFISEGAAAQDNGDLMVKLAEAYSGVIDQTKSYNENLAALQIAAMTAGGELEKLHGDVNALAEKKIDLQVNMANLKVDVDVEGFNNQINKMKGHWYDMFTWLGRTVSGTVTEAQYYKNLTEPMINAIKDAKNDKELQKASFDMQMALFNSDRFKQLGSAEKDAMLVEIKKLTDDKKNAIETANRDIAKDIMDFRSTGMNEEDLIKGIAEKYHKTEDEVRNLIALQQQEKDKVDETARSVEGLANSFNTALDASKKHQKEAISALAEAINEYKKALATGDQGEIEKATKNLATIQEESHKNYALSRKDEISLNKALAESEKQLGMVQDKTKTSKTAWDKEAEYANKLNELLIRQAEARAKFQESLDKQTADNQIKFLDEQIKEIQDLENVPETFKLNDIRDIEGKKLDIKKQQELVAFNYSRTLANEKAGHELMIAILSNKDLLKEKKEYEDEYTTISLEKGEQREKDLKDLNDKYQKLAIPLIKDDKTRENVEKAIGNNLQQITLETTQGIKDINDKNDTERIKSEIEFEKKFRNAWLKEKETTIKSELALTDASNEAQIEMRRQLQDELLTIQYADALGAINPSPAQSAAIEEYYNKLKGLERTKATETANLIADNAEREKAIKIAAAEAGSNKEILLANGSAALELAAFVKMNDEKLKAEQDYILKSSALAAGGIIAMQAFADGLMSYNFDEKAYQDKRTAALKAISDNEENLNKEESDLITSLAKREVSTKEFLNKTNIVYKHAAEENAKYAADAAAQSFSPKFLDNINAGILSASKALETESKKLLSAAIKDYESYQNSLDKINKKIYDGQWKSIEEYGKLLDEKNQLEQDSKDKLGQIAIAAVEMTWAAMGQALVNQKNVGKAFLDSMFSMLQALVPIISAQILGESLATIQSISTFGATGFIEWAALTLALEGAVAAAKAAVDSLYFTGGYTGDKGIHEAAGLVHGQEFVMNAAATKKDIKDFEVINERRLSIEEYVMSYRQDIVNKIAMQSCYSEENIRKINSESFHKISERTETTKTTEMTIQNLITENKKLQESFITSKEIEERIDLQYRQSLNERKYIEIMLEHERRQSNDYAAEFHELSGKFDQLLVETKKNTLEIKGLKGQIKTRIAVDVRGKMKADGGSILAEIEGARIRELIIA